MAELETECIVIGSGVIGLSIARSLCHAGYDVIVLEKIKRLVVKTALEIVGSFTLEFIIVKIV